MWTIFLFLFVIFVDCTVCVNKSDIDYFEYIIKENFNSARNYTLPNNAGQFEPVDKTLKDFGTFDFIILGAGSTGSVIANRLTEIRDFYVLLLEAGEYGTDFTDIPAFNYIPSRSKYNWGYKTTPQKTACLAKQNKICDVPRGKAVGGTSVINGMAYVRGNPKDFEKWPQPEWSYENILPYLKKSENLHPPKNFPTDENFHGFNGNVDVQIHDENYLEQEMYLQAFKELGYNLTDYNGKNNIGVGPAQLTTKYGTRVDGNHAFIEPAKNRPNLNISTNSFVIKILISKSNKLAYGVKFIRDGFTYVAKARKEVIVCTGVVTTPQLLKLSGIGPRSELKKLRIPVIQDLPVGETLRDHTALSFYFNFNKEQKVTPLRSLIKEYLINGSGFFTLGAPLTIGFHQTAIEKQDNFPDLEVILTSVIAPTVKSDGEYDFKKIITSSTSFIITLVGLHPKSYGNIRLKSKSPFMYPLINSNLLSDPENLDIETLYEGIKFIQKLLKTSSFRSLNVTLTGNEIKECEHFTFETKEYWYCFIRQMAYSSYHLVGSCPMGQKGNKKSVVDDNLKVYRVHGLRVADSSVFPYTASGHPNSICMMIGEKISDIIKKEYSKLS